MPPRLPVEPAELDAGRLELGGERAHYLRTVLRLQVADALELFDGAGRRARAVVEVAERRRVVLSVGEAGPAPTVEAAVALTLLFGLPRGDGADRIVRAATELGVAALVPVLTARTVARPPADRKERRRERWRRIATEAARQCGRSRTPTVEPPRPLVEALAALPEAATLRLLPWEGEPTAVLTDLLPQEPPAAATVLVGPEGGWTDAEVAAARAAGFATWTLGPRILRTPTAAVVATALVLHRLGELG